MKHDADDAIARLMRGRVEPGPAAGPCLDAESIAAWFDGTLTAAQQREAEAHASTCARCQALLAAMAQTEPAPAPRRSLMLVRWFAPALVAAAAVAVWINVAGRSADVAPAPSDSAARAAAAPGAPAPPAAPPEAAFDRSLPLSAKRLEKRDGSAAANEPAYALKGPARKERRADAKDSRTVVSAQKQEAAPAAAPAAVAERQPPLKEQPNAA